ncbi:hypothetical protein ACHHYP_00409 [Achlya hypogyna]|uniref:Apple domain-containing protein n=1 Tax=Achlya hypogyna TaxID=1202772 RepID=A0A1V9ZUM1_ACHHY|nr:hypothetical protein ACHHYP_00409 [Achlya hypogyna]
MASSTALCGSIKQGVDYSGNDIRSFSVNGDAATQLAQCCQGCSTTSGCVGFSIDDGTCWLKHKLANATPLKGVVSGSYQKNRLRRQ